MAFFPDVPQIRYEGPGCKLPLAFRWYNPEEMIEGKSMKDHLRFSIVYWHTMRGTGAEPFGPGTAVRPWDDGSNSLDNALRRVEAAFEIFEKLQAPYYAFHDRDVAPEGATLRESHANLDRIAKSLKEHQDKTGIKCCGAQPISLATPDLCMVRQPVATPTYLPTRRLRSRNAWEVTKMLGGENYVFWGGREGYQCLYNTDMQRELEHLAAFFHMAVDYAHEIEFDAQFLIEPKPKEPTKHQYDSDAAACLNFLRANDLHQYFKSTLKPIMRRLLATA